MHELGEKEEDDVKETDSQRGRRGCERHNYYLYQSPIRHTVSWRQVKPPVSEIILKKKILVFLFSDITGCWKNIHDIFCPGDFLGLFLFGEFDPGCGSHGL